MKVHICIMKISNAQLRFLLYYFFFLSFHTLRADTLYLRNGKTLEGVFLGVQNGYYKFKVQSEGEEGKIHCVPRLELDDLRTEQDPKKRQPLAKSEGDEIVCGGKQKEEETPDLAPEPKKIPPIPVLPTDKPPIKKAPPVPPSQIQKDELESDPQNKKEKPKLEGSPKEEQQPKPQAKEEKKIPKLEGETQKEPVPKPKPQIEKEAPKLEGSPKEELEPKPQPKPKEEKEVPKLDEEVPEPEIEPEDQAETEIEEEIPEDQKPGFLSRSWNSVKDFFKKLPGRLKKFYKQYMYPMQGSVALGTSTLKLNVEERQSVSYEEIGVGSEVVEGTLDLETPNQFSGFGLRLGLTNKELLRDKYYPKSALLIGLDWIFAFNVKSDRPLRASGTVSFPPVGGIIEDRFVSFEREYSYSYNYLTLSAGPTYYFLKDSSVSLLLRLPFFGSYSQEQSAEEGNVSNSGSIQAVLPGFGLILSHKLPWYKEHDLSVHLLYSHDNLDFDGAVYDHTFLGIGAGIEF